MFVWKPTAFSWPSAIFLLPEQTTMLACEIVGYKLQWETKNCRQHRVYARTQPQWLYKKRGKWKQTSPRSGYTYKATYCITIQWWQCSSVTSLRSLPPSNFSHSSFCDTQPLVINHLLRSNSACVIRNPRGSKVWLQAFHPVFATCFGGNICMRYSDGAALSTDVMKFNAI